MIEDPERTLEKLSKNGPALPDLSEFEIHLLLPEHQKTMKK